MTLNRVLMLVNACMFTINAIAGSGRGMLIAGCCTIIFGVLSVMENRK